jgi:hypothetical protein
MTRSIVPGALCVCSVAKTRWPVSAAVSAVPMVAHLAEEDHVGVLAESGAESAREVGRVDTDLALVNDAALVPVHELDRVLDREDVLGALAVDLVDQRGKGGRLTRAGRARHEHEAAGLVGERVEARRDPELLERLDLGRNQAEGRAERLALPVDVHAEAREAGNGVREVDLAVDLEILLLLGREDPVEELLRRLGRQRLDVLQRLQVPAHADHRVRAHRDVQIGRVSRHHLLEQIVDGVQVRRHSPPRELSAGVTPFLRGRSEAISERFASPHRGRKTARGPADTSGEPSAHPYQEDHACFPELRTGSVRRGAMRVSP